MKPRYLFISAIAAVSIFCGSEALAQRTNYSRSHLSGHRAGVMYSDDYQTTHVRNTDGATNHDSFDEGQGSSADQRGMVVSEGTQVSGKRIQKTHEFYEDIYLNPGRSKTIIVPSNNKNQYSVFGTYQRWYNYDTDGQIDRSAITFPGLTNYQYVMADGTYSGSFITGDDALSSALWKFTVTGPRDFDGTPYRLACDMSDYTDTDRPRSNGDTFDEPTLGQRLIYTIYPASVIKDKMSKSEYYEVHDIHLPNVRQSGAKTLEQVSLNMAANNYYVPGEDGDCGALTVSLNNNDWSAVGRYLSLATTSISGSDRKISFNMNGTIPDGQVVYIEVKKNGYLIAQFKLTFDANTEGLSQSTIEDIERRGENDQRYFRTNAYLDNFKLLTSLNFDFDDVSSSNTSNNGSKYYPYPLDWETSNYGFYAGGTYNKDQRYPQWGQYGITTGNGFGGDNDEALLPGSKYHLYIDANNYPGTICELPFSANFCQSSRLYVTAWMKSVNTSSDDASVLFILKGVNDDGTTQVLHTQSSGQIHATSGLPWYQLYFEFTSPGYTYDNYVLEVFNNCASTTGGDFCIDDVRVYISPLQVNAKTTKPLCTDEVEASVQVDINYELLLDRLGIEEASQGQSVVTTGYYSFVNKTTFDRAIAQGTSFNDAFAASVVHGEDVYKGSSEEYFGTIRFSNNYLANNGQNGMVDNLAGSGANRKIAFTASVAANNFGGENVTLVAGDEYYMVFTKTNVTGMSPVEMATAYGFEDPDCAISGTFIVDGPLIININGDVVSTAETVCIGQQPLIDVEMRDGAGGIVPDAVFDWYFGSIQEFRNEVTEEIPELGGITHTLRQALELFRLFYPDATAVSDATVPAQSEDNVNEKLYQQDIDLIERLSEDYSASGLNAKLTLSASRSLSIRLMNPSTYVVLIPVGTEPESVGGDTQVSICWEPTQILLRAQDGAPLLDVGRQDVNYEGAGDGYAVKVRLGKEQYDALNQLAVPVRDPRLNDGSSVRVANVRNDRNIYLTWTDDPRYIDQLIEQGGYSMVVGQVNTFDISADASADAKHVVLTFHNSSDFQPREGYHYSVAVRFTTPEVQIEDCYGTLVVPLVIVPDYEVWVGKPDGNWNDDANWRRAEPEDIKKAANSGYMTNADNGTSAGYVPLGRTRVLIPTDDGVQLYEASQIQGAGGILNLDANKGALSDPTANIEYDLTVSRNNTLNMFVAGLYNTNQCYQIHFNARGQMLNSHLLTYNRAWTNVEVPAGRWTTVATPLQGVFTGDWYTKTTGEESAEYFTDLTFGDGNDRLQPYVLQRSWNEHASIDDTGTGVDDGTHIAGAHTSDVTWSSTYNDVGIQTKPGEGFSILAGKGSATQDGGTVEFRLPKWDEQYDGFSDRFYRVQVNSGLLFSDNLKQTASANVTISPSHDGRYALIGNPFTSSLDMDEFFAENTGFDKVYWTATDSDPYTGVEGSDGNWLTSDGQSTALVPPYTAFYARQTKPSASPLRVTFSRDMAVMPTSNDAETQSLQGMTLLAAGAKGNSTALLRYDAAADNGYAKSEDVQLMRESAGTAAPLVYTVAGDMAANINQVKDLQQIPLGLFAADGDVTTLTFTGTDALLEPSLYDAELNTDTPITEGMTLSVSGASHGRYFIRARGAGEGTSGISEVVGDADGDGDVTVYSVAERQVVVSSSAGLRAVRVYAVGGQLLKSESVADGRTAVTLDGVDSGVAIVRVTTAAGTTVKKITVK